MKKFNEWKNEESNVEEFLDNIKDLSNQLKLNLETFQGERFAGFLNLIGGVKELQRTIAEIENNCVTKEAKEEKVSCCSEKGCDCDKFTGKLKICKGCKHSKSKHS